MKKTLVVGAGLTGRSVMRYLQRTKQPFDVYDTREQLPDMGILARDYPESEFFLGKQVPLSLSDYQFAVVSPGLSPTTPIIQQCLVHDVDVVGDIELFAKACQKPVIAITGTNGKSTVTTLVGEILKKHGLRVAVAGNIGVGVLDSLLGDYDVWVLELSSFQLTYQRSLKPAVACILNITQDHLDWHGTFEHYCQSKQRIYNNATTVVCNADEPLTYPITGVLYVGFSLSSDLPTPFSLDKNGTFHHLGQPLFTKAEIRLNGTHDFANVLAAMTIADAFGCRKEAMVEAICAFNGLPHRSQWVRTLNDVKWINDSKGTNVGATVAALAGLAAQTEGAIVWIAGGVGKGADFTPLGPLANKHVRCALLLGASQMDLANALPQAVPKRFVASMEEAVRQAQTMAQPGDCVLLSPACASFDMFENYMQRGDVFAALVKQL